MTIEEVQTEYEAFKQASVQKEQELLKQIDELTAERDSLKNDKVGLSLKIDNLNNQLLRKPIGQMQDVKSPVDKLMEDLQ